MTAEQEAPSSLRQLSQVLLDGIQEIIGRVGLTAVLNLARMSRVVRPTATGSLTREISTDEVRAMRIALEELYGPRGGHGVALRAGRASFRYFLRHFGDYTGLTRIDYRLQPAPQRIKVGLTAIARVYSNWCDKPIEVDENETSWFWRIPDCPWCSPKEGEEMVCHYAVGLLQEYVTWASAGRIFHVLETECRAANSHYCVIQIDKQPLD